MSINLTSDIFAGGANVTNGELRERLLDVARQANRASYSELDSVVDTSAGFTPYADGALVYSVPVGPLNADGENVGVNQLTAPINSISNNFATLASIINGMLELDEAHVAADSITDSTGATKSATFTYSEPALPNNNTLGGLASGISMNLYLNYANDALSVLGNVANTLLFNAGRDRIGNAPAEIASREVTIGNSLGNLVAGSLFPSAEAGAEFDHAVLRVEATKIIRSQLTIFAAMKKLRNKPSVTTIIDRRNNG